MRNRFLYIPVRVCKAGLSGVALSLMLSLAVSSQIALAQNSRIEVGSWSCPPTGGTPGWKEEDCGRITFSPFGDTPQIFMSISSGGILGGFSVSANNVARDGFTPHWAGSSYTKSFSGTWIAVGPGLVRGLVKPKYMVMTVIYAPPGTNGGKSSSSVTYGTGSTTGTTTSTSNTFKSGVGVELDASGGIFSTGAGVNVGFDYSASQTDTSSYDVKKSTGTTISRTGPGQDGVNHDEDQIYLWLNPTIDVAVAPSSVAWHFDGSTQAEIQSVYVGDLKNPGQMAPGVKAALAKYGITEADFPDIIKRDPFSDPNYNPDPDRFLPIGFNFPYSPPYTASDPVTTLRYDLSTASVSTNTHDAIDDYKVSLTVTAQGGFFDFFTLKVKDSSSWEWTNKTSFSSSVGKTESASATIGGPAYGYAGPTQVQVLYDTVYRSFAFVMIGSSTPPALSGTLKDDKGVPVAHKLVSVSVGGLLIKTITDQTGHYSFYDSRVAPAIVRPEP